MSESESTDDWAWDREYISDYIYWISELSGKWATFSPSRNIQVGDYGVSHENTNTFERRGNIFKDEEIIAMIPELATDEVWKPRTTSEEDKSVTTHAMEMTDLGPSEDAILQLRFRGQGEFLVMYRPRTVEIPQPIDFTKLSKIEKLTGMRLVTEVVSCPAYAMHSSVYFLGYVIILSLNHSSQDISADSGVEHGWSWKGSRTVAYKHGWSWNGSGTVVYKHGYNSKGNYEYTPLFSLTEIPDQLDNTQDKDTPDKTVPLVNSVHLRLPIPTPLAGDGNYIIKMDEVGVAPWISGKSRRPEKWKNRLAHVPSDPQVTSKNHQESIHMNIISAPEPPSETIIQSAGLDRVPLAVGAPDHSKFHSDGYFLSCCCRCQ